MKLLNILLVVCVFLYPVSLLPVRPKVAGALLAAVTGSSAFYLNNAMGGLDREKARNAALGGVVATAGTAAFLYRRLPAVKVARACKLMGGVRNHPVLQINRVEQTFSEDVAAFYLDNSKHSLWQDLARALVNCGEGPHRLDYPRMVAMQDLGFSRKELSKASKLLGEACVDYSRDNDQDGTQNCSGLQQQINWTHAHVNDCVSLLNKSPDFALECQSFAQEKIS